MSKKKGTKTTETEQATVVEAPSKNDNSEEHITDLLAGSNMVHDAFMELANTDRVAEAVSYLETALKNANKYQEALRESKTAAGMKDTSRYFGYYDIALPGTTSDIPASDTEWGHKDQREREGKALLRVYSNLEKPIDPASNPFREGGCAVLLSRGTSVTQTKGNRIYQSGFVPHSFLELISSLSQEDASKVWVLLAAGYVFNQQKRVTGPAQIASSLNVDDIEEIDLSDLD